MFFFIHSCFRNLPCEPSNVIPETVDQIPEIPHEENNYYVENLFESNEPIVR